MSAFRFGHSKVRAAYDNFNNLQIAGSLDLLFKAGKALPSNWIIDWIPFLEADNRSRFPRPMDPSLTLLLLDLNLPEVRNLAVRNLLRGYILRMPTGQAVARAMASEGIVPLTKEELLLVASRIPAPKVDPPRPPLPSQSQVLPRTDFLNRTPLWYYILAEAAFYHGGKYLGPMGSTIVVEVLIDILRNSTYSILRERNWRPTLGDTPGQFDLKDLLKLARVL